jgi:hypothetical protein
MPDEPGAGEAGRSAESPVLIAFRNGGHKVVTDLLDGASVFFRPNQVRPCNSFYPPDSPNEPSYRAIPADAHPGTLRGTACGWVVVPPPHARDTVGGRKVTRPYGVLGSWPDCPADLRPAAPLGDRQWLALWLALEGVLDDTEDPARLDETGAGEVSHWFWEGRLAAGCMTVLAGPPKGGKTTLFRELLRAAGRDDPRPFLGRAVEPFSALVVSEEPRAAWANGPTNCRLRFFEGDPIAEPSAWRKYVGGLGRIACVHRCKVLALDTWARLCASDENDPAAVTAALAPLRDLAADWDLAPLILHHTTKGGSGIEAVRGSSAIVAQADAVITVARVSDDPTDRRRTLESVGRLAPPERLEYVMLPDGSLALPGQLAVRNGRGSLRGAGS